MQMFQKILGPANDDFSYIVDEKGELVIFIQPTKEDKNDLRDRNFSKFPHQKDFTD